MGGCLSCCIYCRRRDVRSPSPAISSRSGCRAIHRSALTCGPGTRGIPGLRTRCPQYRRSGSNLGSEVLEPTARLRCRERQRTGGGISETDERAILARVRGGDATAYAELVLRHAPVAKRTAVFLGAGSEADDVVQESFVK